ncbi:MAG TPA: hypothetical protein VH599_19305 [Ktedonobacterales bacterium]
MPVSAKAILIRLMWIEVKKGLSVVGNGFVMCDCAPVVGYLAYLLRFLMLVGPVLKLPEKKLDREPSGGRAVSRWREYMLYVMDHSVLPTIEGSAAGAREGSV